MNKVIVNVTTKVNNAKIRKEIRNGKDVIIVPSVTMPDDVVMNGVLYPAAEIKKGYKTLTNTLAPNGHPKVDDKYVSAREPQALNDYYIGAWNENVVQKDGRVHLDKVIDVEVAERTEKGREVLEAINEGRQIHTSTGIFCNQEDSGEDGYDKIATNLYFDHDAILINEEGAATPKDGVGMLVNGEEIKVLNSAVDMADSDLDWALDSVTRALEKKRTAPLRERMKTVLMDIFTSDDTTQTANKGDADMSDDKKFDELSAKVNELESKIPETVTNAVTEAMKPVLDAQTALLENTKASEDAKRTALVNKLVKTAKWTEEDLADFSLNALTKLAEKGEVKSSSGVGSLDDGPKDEWAGYSLNSVIDEETKSNG